MSKQQHIFVFLCAAVLWIGMAAFMVVSTAEGFGIHKLLTTYVRNEIAVNYHIEDADLEMLSCEHNADTIRCLYRATDAEDAEHRISVTFLRHTLRNQHKVFSMTLLPDSESQAQNDEMTG